MKVSIRLFSDMKKYLPEGSVNDSIELFVDKGLSVKELKNVLEIPEQQNCVVTVNDTNRQDDFILKEMDLVKIFPVARGG
jgi:hypothetical protein